MNKQASERYLFVTSSAENFGQPTGLRAGEPQRGVDIRGSRLPYARKLALQTFPALCPVSVLLVHIPLDQSPSLHLLWELIGVRALFACCFFGGRLWTAHGSSSQGAAEKRGHPCHEVLISTWPTHRGANPQLLYRLFVLSLSEKLRSVFDRPSADQISVQHRIIPQPKVACRTAPPVILCTFDHSCPDWVRFHENSDGDP